MSCENMDYDARWPWAACAKKPPRLTAKDYTGCACHDSCGEAWFNAHMRPKSAAQRN